MECGWSKFGVLGAALVLGGCGLSDPAGSGGVDGPSVSVNVAALNLSGVGDVVWDVEVLNGADPAQVVWQRRLSSSGYGDGAGSASYVGPCDADPAVSTNTVKVWVVGVYSGPVTTPGSFASGGAGGVSGAALEFQNPTVDGPLTQTVVCAENADVAVQFDVALMRPAQQGFFDVAVGFDDIFCSAKLDCERDDGSDLDLLYNPATGGRDMTAVLGFACTGDASLDTTFLYMNDIRIVCDGVGYAPITVNPTGAGNIDTNASGSSDVEGYLFGASVSRGTEQLAGKAYWNTSLGLNEAEFADAGNCVLSGRATASAKEWDQTTSGFPLPEGTVYPVVEWNVPLTSGTARVCTSHGVNEAGSGVETVYDGYLPLSNAFTWSSEVVYLDARYDATNDDVLRAAPCDPGLVPNGGGGCVECLAPTDCPEAANDCTERTCVANVCGQDDLSAGTSCGDPSDDDCTNPDTCDGAGACLDNHENVGSSCGDATDDDCTMPDTCDGAGACLGNHENVGTSCGDPTDSECTGPDACDGAGACLDYHEISGTSCGDPTDDDCTDPDTCNGSGVCLTNDEVTGLCSFNCGDPLVDGRDGQSYDTVAIGSVCWMRENLNHGTYQPAPNAQDPAGPVVKWCYGNVASNCDLWGGHYTYNNAVRGAANQVTQGVCPNGWRIPTSAEWQTMHSTQGSSIFTVSQSTLSLLFSGRYTNQWYYGTDCTVTQYVQTHHWYSDTGAAGFFWMFGDCPTPSNYGGTSLGQLDQGRAVRCVKQ